MAAIISRRVKLPGRKYSARWWNSSPTAWCSRRRSNSTASPNPWACRATTTEHRRADPSAGSAAVLLGENPMSGRLSRKVALVTAAGQGIGAAIATAFVDEGANVVATDIDAGKLKALKVKKRLGLD